jgi:hypothetical protein
MMTGPEFVCEVRTALLTGVQPPDPETVIQFDAAVAEFPDQRWRWQAAPDIAEALQGELPADPLPDRFEGQLARTFLEGARTWGPLFSAVIATSGEVVAEDA